MCVPLAVLCRFCIQIRSRSICEEYILRYRNLLRVWIILCFREDNPLCRGRTKREAKTKEMAAFLKAFNLEKTVLLVMDNSDESVLRASANIKAISTIAASQLNTYEVVKNAKLVISKEAVQQIQEVYGK